MTIARLVLFGLLVVVVVGLVWFIRIFRHGSEFLYTTGLTPFNVVSLLFDSGVPLLGKNGRTNILLLGVGGGTHAGADLTDTMLIVSVDKKATQLTFVSLPRDLWSDTLKDKINSAYHYGETKKVGGGFVLSKVVAEDVVGMPVHYAMLVDFSGFEKIIDLVGEIDVRVEKGFTDTEYPLAGRENDECDGDKTYRCRYEALTFASGLVHMSGEMALKYVRSRHATGDEGTDFARSRRQQEVLVAFKSKLLQPASWNSWDKVNNLYRAFWQTVKTDMSVGELLTVGKTGWKARAKPVWQISLEKELINPAPTLYGGRYVLIPRESWEEIHKYIFSKLN